jgi:hypothetical protein
MSIEANKAVVTRVVEEMWNRGDAAAVEELIAPGMVEHGAFGSGTGGGTTRATRSDAFAPPSPTSSSRPST